MKAIVNVTFDTSRAVSTLSVETMVATGVAYFTGGRGHPGNASAKFGKLSAGGLATVDVNSPPGADISSVLPRAAPGPHRGSSFSASAVAHLAATPWFTLARGTSGTGSAIVRIARMVNYEFSAPGSIAFRPGKGLPTVVTPVIPVLKKQKSP